MLDPTIPTDIGVRSQRQRIVEAMIESCAEKTYPATTIADIVRHASISRTTFYKRFPDKRACFDAALDACIEELRDAAAGAHRPSDPPAEAIRKAAAAMLALMAAKPARAQLVLGEAISVEPAVIGRYRSALAPPIEALFAAAGEPGDSYASIDLAFGRARILTFNLIATDRTADLPELLPEIVYVVLLPFVGHEEAARQAGLAEGSGERSPSSR